MKKRNKDNKQRGARKANKRGRRTERIWEAQYNQLHLRVPTAILIFFIVPGVQHLPSNCASRPAILKSADLTKISSSFRSFFSIFQFFFLSISISISPCFYYYFDPYFNYILSTFIMITLFILINFVLERIKIKIQFIVICLQVFVKKISDKDFRNCNRCFETFYVVRSLS